MTTLLIIASVAVIIGLMTLAADRRDVETIERKVKELAKEMGGE
jgi:hypothetical protein